MENEHKERVRHFGRCFHSKFRWMNNDSGIKDPRVP